MDITLYKFNKKANSTATPGSSVERETLPCQVKTPSSIISPVVQLSKGTNPIGFNYAYISEWGRYYFINDITYSLGVWVLDLRVDVLASFRSDIRSSEQYVLRSASDFDDDVLDHFYPTKGGSVSSSSTFSGTITRPDDQYAASTSGYFTNNYNQGFFVLGIIGNTSGSNSTGVSYYELTFSQFNSFISDLMSYVPSDMGDLGDGVKKAFYDPMQYIVSCRWYPIDMKVGVAEQVPNIEVGGYQAYTGGSATLLNAHRGVHLRTSASIPKHPGSSGYAYRQLAPYSDYKLTFEPFGTIALDSTKLYGASTLILDWYIDNATGDAELFVSTDLVSNIAHSIANVGVEVPIAQISVDYIGGVASAASGITGFISGVLSGNAAEAISSAITGIGNTVNAASPTVSSKGTTGSFLSYVVGYPKLYLYSLIQVDPDNDRYGRPLCEVKTLSSLSGYVLCSEPAIESMATAAEKVQIESYLSTGAFLE